MAKIKTPKKATPGSYADMKQKLKRRAGRVAEMMSKIRAMKAKASASRAGASQKTKQKIERKAEKMALKMISQQIAPGLDQWKTDSKLAGGNDFSEVAKVNQPSVCTFALPC